MSDERPTPAELEELTPPAAPADSDPVPEAEDESMGYRLSLPMFEGPLDLLLHLIRQHKIDIFDIPIAFVTEQYNQYLDAMTELDLEIAADFVYIAALLIHIKSKMLLPRDEEAEEGEDPRSELVDRLLEYQRFRGVAEQLSEIDVVRMGVWTRPPTPRPQQDGSEIDMSEVSLFDLIDAFRTALVRFRHAHPQAIELKRSVHKVSDKMRELVDQLATKSPIRLLWYLEGKDRPELIAIFLGMLELVRLGGISLRQKDSFGEILIHRTEMEIDQTQFAVYDN